MKFKNKINKQKKTNGGHLTVSLPRTAAASPLLPLAHLADGAGVAQNRVEKVHPAPVAVVHQLEGVRQRELVAVTEFRAQQVGRRFSIVLFFI